MQRTQKKAATQSCMEYSRGYRRILGTTDLSASELIQKDQGTDLSGNYAKAHGEQGGEARQAARLHQGQVVPDHIVVFYDGVTTYVDKERATDIIYTDFCKDFYTIPHNILL